MKSIEFKKLLKESVREVIQEELQNFFASKFGGNPISYSPSQPQASSYSIQENAAFKSYKENMLESMKDLKKGPIPFYQQEPQNISNSINNILAETAAEMTQQDFANIRQM